MRARVEDALSYHLNTRPQDEGLPLFSRTSARRNASQHGNMANLRIFQTKGGTAYESEDTCNRQHIFCFFQNEKACMEAQFSNPVAFIELIYAMGLLGPSNEAFKSKEALEECMGRQQVLLCRIRRQHAEVRISCKLPRC